MGKKPRFFKLVTTNNSPHLRLPLLFVEKYGEMLPEIAKLRTSSGETWNVELEQVAEGYRFGRGWTKFAADVGLSMGEFLVINFNIDESTFDVLVFGINGCERRIPGRRNCSVIEDSDPDEDVERVITDLTCIDLNALEVDDNGGSDAENETASDSDEMMISSEVHPSFKITLTEHHRYRMWVNRDFVEAAGILKDKSVVLQYPPRKHCWAVLLCQSEYGTRLRTEMSRGWKDFWESNGLVIGETYLFEYIPDKNVIEVKLITEEN